ncbi:hypothetical protein [Rubinisphaera margarita]|uniref:hypothetical protein n=1 Tax=Rubinisphaera margarita TaxID=2909586 RepID=UPI001EE81789|nr:hypothetical protein [Rubinisphaera margarita]MCG6157674.1 hypothetical protein [Rubinisphaera margarita]
MISSLGRVLAVLTAMFSAAFMAFAISRYATVPDWSTEARDLEMFTLTRTEGETPSWSASTRRTQESVHTSTNMAEVLEKMYQRAKQDIDAQVQEHEANIPSLEAQIAATRTAIEEDDAAVTVREELLADRLQEMDDEVARLTAEIEREKAVAEKTQMERERRRSDVFRLREQLGEVEADYFRAVQLHQELTDMIRRTQGNVVKLESRNRQLQESVNQVN